MKSGGECRPARVPRAGISCHKQQSREAIHWLSRDFIHGDAPQAGHEVKSSGYPKYSALAFLKCFMNQAHKRISSTSAMILTPGRLKIRSLANPTAP